MSCLELISSSSPSSVTVISKQSRAEYSSEECSLEVEECGGIVEEPSAPPPPPPCVPPEVVFNVEATNTGITPRHSSNRDYSGGRADDTTRLMSKILIPLAVGGMFMVSEMKSFESVSRAGVLIFWVSISLMVLGLNIKFKWLERVGHMLFFIGLMLVCSPIIIGPKLDPRFLWVPPLVAALLFGSSVYFE